ncbi:MAG: hypothetical protein ABI693_03385 [Bryobacteraceae bacterium]
MNIFIGGSIGISNLNAVIRDRLDDFRKRGNTILIGDANGADKAVQTYLARHDYRNVTVFCMEECRNNVGTWPVRHVLPPSGRERNVMAHEAGCGMMLWDAKSNGTLQNVLNLVGAGKRTLVYFAPSKDFHVVANEKDLRSLLARCQSRDLETIVRGLGLKTPRPQPHARQLFD